MKKDANGLTVVHRYKVNSTVRSTAKAATSRWYDQATTKNLPLTIYTVLANRSTNKKATMTPRVLN